MTLLQLAVALAIALTDASEHERRLLFVYAADESGFQDDIAWCRTVGDGGRSLGIWQTSFRSAGEQFAICHDLSAAARVALERLRESYRMCGHLEERFRGSAYCSGRCDSQLGRSISRARWERASWRE